MATKYNFLKGASFMGETIFLDRLILFYSVAFFLLNTNNGLAQGGTTIKEEVVLTKDTSSKSEVHDARPLISPDGKTLFFGRRNYAKNIGGKTDLQDIWNSSLDTTGKFSKARSMGKIINTPMANGICSISPNGTEIIITNDYFGNKTAPIAKSKKINGIWKSPEPVFIEDYYNKCPYSDFFVSYENNVLFVAAQRKDGHGDQDIYVCMPGQNGNWLKPVNLGVKINSKTAEYAPFLSADGKTLFFVSDRAGGVGGSDIYAVKRLDESWVNWSEPKNLGLSVNTPGDENYFSLTPDLNTILVESLEKETSKRSIYKINMPALPVNDFFVSVK